MKIGGLIVALLLFVHVSFAQDGPYAPAVGTEGSTAMHVDSLAFVQWANQAIINRGWQNSADTSLGLASVGDEESCIGIAGQNGVVSLGDGGSVTLSFDGYIYDGPGYDFAIFENSFSDTYLELAIVEVSSDGENYFAFPSSSLTQTDSQIGTFGLLDPTYIHNLAGKYRALYGTPFDLNELEGIDSLDINEISHVRIIDVVGAISGDYLSTDSEGNAINDPYPTEFDSGGFDLDALGIINWSTQTSIQEYKTAIKRAYPNPFKSHITIETVQPNTSVEVFSVSGIKVDNGKSGEDAILKLNTENWKEGVYIIHLPNSQSYPIIKY